VIVKTASRLRWLGVLFAGLACIILACSIVGNEKTQESFSFNKSYDTLAQFDSVHIVLKDTTGKTIDNLYRGKVDTVHEVENLLAPHWNGGIAVLSVIGYQGGVIVYRVDKKFNGKNDQILDTLRIILPGTALTADALDFQMTEGDSIAIPKITVTPLELSDKTVTFTSSSPLLLQVGPGFMRALQRGHAVLTATLNSNPAKTLAFNVTILPNPLTPDTLFISPDTLQLAAGGAPGQLTVTAKPSSADVGVNWSVKDPVIANILGDGKVVGLKAGLTMAFATSKRKPSVRDSGMILVLPPVAVAQVRFKTDSLDLFVNGAAESLFVDVLPALANPGVLFSTLDSSVVSLVGGRVRGLNQGATSVFARSADNPLLADTLKVTVFPAQHIDSVRVAPDTVQLYTGGQNASLTAKVFPNTAIQSVLWRSQNPAIAAIDGAGTAKPVGAGKTLLIALSRADSSKQDTAVAVVKRDMPQLSVGRDTVISVGTTMTFKPVVTQAYGAVVQFRWDLNGDGTWEGTSDSLKSVSNKYDTAKDYLAAFYVKDTEGNDTTVYRKIKVVAGQVVQILEPADSTYTHLFTIDVRWTVNGKEQDSLKKQNLVLGANTLTRSAKDEGGNLYSASVTVFVDTTPPNRPLVHGPAITTSKTPAWSWASGGGGGSGAYKYWLDVDDSSKGKLTTDTTFTSGTDLAEGTHTLFVAERDKAGNWSAAGRLAVKIDFTLPGTPLVAVTPALSPTNVRRPVWNWTSGGNGGSGAFQFKMDNVNLATGATSTTALTFTPASDLANGLHILYVQEKDSAGNWSASGSAQIFIDTIAPTAPVVTNTSPSPTNNTTPTWSWAPGGGGRGLYRYKVGDTIWASGSQGSETSYTASAALAEGIRTLYVEERDSAGNWSAAGSKAIRIDLTKPGAPIVTSASKRTTTQKPTWTWTSAGNAGGGYRYKVDNADLSAGALTPTGTAFTSGVDLSEGFHSLYVQEKDSAGNWSDNGSYEIEIHGLTGYAVGGYQLFKTIDGGTTWQSILTETNPDTPIRGAYFSHRDTGNIIGGGGLTFHTVDGGQHWISPLTGIDSAKDLKSVWFPNSRTGYVCATNGFVYKTTNVGVSWNSLPNLFASGLTSLHFPDINNGFITTAQGDGLFKIWKTTDGGQNWNQAGDSIPSYGGAVFATSSSTVFVVVDGAKILKSTNGGASWASTPAPNNSGLISVMFPTTTTGYAAGYAGAIVKTTNGGSTWTALSSETTENLYSVQFLDANYGFASGNNGTILKTTDGGQKWVPLTISTVVEISSIFFP